MITLKVNGNTVETDAASDTPLLWVLRDHLGMTETKFGCGKSLRGIGEPSRRSSGQRLRTRFSRQQGNACGNCRSPRPV